MTKIKDWFHSYWYYYKWYFLVGGFVLIVLLICLSQCVGKTNYDIYLTYAGPDYISQSLNEVSDSVKSTLSGDLENKVQEISVRDLIYVNSKLAEEYKRDNVYFSAAQNNDNAKVVRNEAAVGDSYIYIIDKELYDSLSGSGVFASLSDIFGKDNIPKGAIDEYAVQFGKTEFCQYYNSLFFTSDNLVICLRGDFSDSFMNFFKGSKKAENSYALHKEVFISIINYQAPK